jgi:hypothetical protein
MEHIHIGGVAVTQDEALAGLATLRDGTWGVMVRQPLARDGNPLAHMDYHAVARGEMGAHPEVRLPPGSHHEPAAHVKAAVIHYLERVLA